MTEQLNADRMMKLEKMASLGALAAGIAHEINAPMAALKSNSDLFLRYFEKLRTMLFAEDMPIEIRENKKLQTIFSSMDKLNKVNKTAADRMAAVVDTLRRFARSDPAEMQKCNLHEGLDSTLTLIHHMTKDRITIHKHYGDIPEIDCYPNHINSVFLNIMVNALQAIEGEGELTIKTSEVDGHVVISITDSGIGIPPEIQSNIFESGFTTKSSEIGTGLGLSIVKQIVEKHDGTITVESTPGVDTTFHITLPIEAKKRKS